MKTIRFASAGALSAMVGLVLLSAGCAQAPIGKGADPKALYSAACELGRQNKQVKGSVWLKAQSKEASGQFPAFVVATAPAQLRLEVTNLVGGTEAIITVTGQKYVIDVPEAKKRKHVSETGYRSWGGIPLQWATELFLGRIPCPAEVDPSQLSLAVNQDGELVAETRASLKGDREKFVYRFRDRGGRPWADTLHWERLGAFSVAVDFKFEDPDDASGSPKRWEAKSPQGEVKVRWRDREATP